MGELYSNPTNSQETLESLERRHNILHMIGDLNTECFINLANALADHPSNPYPELLANLEALTKHVEHFFKSHNHETRG